MSHDRILFYVDPAWQQGGRYSPIMFPFLGNAFDRNRTPSAFALFEKYHLDTSCYGITADINEADMVLLPYPLALAKFMPNVYRQSVALSIKSGKPLFIDGLGDIQEPVNIPNSLVLRYGGYRFSRQPNEIIIPPLTDDFLVTYRGGELSIRTKGEIPSVGFVGWAALTPMQELRAVVKELPTRLRSIFDAKYRACKKGVFFRRKAIDALRAFKKISLNIIVRPSFSAHSHTASGDQERLRREMVDNLLGSDYGLDIRGDANASTRLFEMMSLGRIPIIVDTERNFPFSDVLDYSTFSFKIDFRDMDKLPEKIAEFHISISPEKFIEMQKTARAAYVNYFSISALMPHIVREIRIRLGKDV